MDGLSTGAGVDGSGDGAVTAEGAAGYSDCACAGDVADDDGSARGVDGDGAGVNAVAKLDDRTGGGVEGDILGGGVVDAAGEIQKAAAGGSDVEIRGGGGDDL